MKTHVLLTALILIGAVLFAPLARAQATLDLSEGYSNSRLFQENNLTLCRGDIYLTDGTLAYGPAYYSYSNALSGRKFCNETDHTLGLRGEVLHGITVDGSYAHFQLAGPDAVRLRAALTWQATEYLSLSINRDIVREGFRTDTTRFQAFWNSPLIGPVDLHLMGGLSKDSWSGADVGQVSIGASTPLPFGLTLNGKYDAYHALRQHRTDRRHTAGDDGLTLTVSRHWQF